MVLALSISWRQGLFSSFGEKILRKQGYGKTEAAFKRQVGVICTSLKDILLLQLSREKNIM